VFRPPRTPHQATHPATLQSPLTSHTRDIVFVCVHHPHPPTMSSSPLLFDLDDSEFPPYPQSFNDSSLKSEPDLTIPLGWDNDPFSPSPSDNDNNNKHQLHRLTASIPHCSPRSDSSARLSVSAPTFAPTSAFNETPLFSPDLWSLDYLNGLDPALGDHRALDQYSDLLMNNANTSIPWAQWTNVVPSDSNPVRSRDDIDMPPTPVDAFSINVDLYQPNNSNDVSYSQVGLVPLHLTRSF